MKGTIRNVPVLRSKETKRLNIFSSVIFPSLNLYLAPMAI